MRKLISVAILALLSSFVFAQSLPSITWGEPIKESKKITLSGIVGTDGDNTYSLKIKVGFFSKLIIEHLDKNLTQIKSEELELKYGKKPMAFEYMTYRNNELLLFSSFRNNKLKKKYLFVQHIDKETLLPKGDLKKMAEIDYQGYSKWNSGSYSFLDSRDESKLLVYYNLPYDKGTKEKFGLHVFDQNNKQIWQKNVTLPELEERYAVKDFSVDNEGNVQVVSIKYTGENKFRRRDLINEYSYEVLNFVNKGNKMRRYPISLTDKYITDVTISVNSDDEILCAGFYSEKGTYSIAGTFFMKVDQSNGKVKKQSFKSFGLDFITENMSARQEKKTKKKAGKGKKIELYQYDLDEMILTDDGGAILVGEQYYVRVVTTTDSEGRTRTTYHYYYNDIIVINITPNGDIAWAKKIAKRQHTVNDGGFYSSYYLSLVGDKLNFMFNDHIFNITEPTAGKTRNFTGRKNGAVALVTMDKNGKQVRKALFKTKEAEVIVRPKVCEQVDSKETIIFGEKKRVNQFGRMVFK